MRKAALHGLAFRDDLAIDDEVLTARISDSFRAFMYGAYPVIKFGRRYYRPIGAPPIETEEKITHNINETIDVSVFDRWRKVPNYRPKNLTDWAKRHSVDIAALHKSVRADDPRITAPD